MNDNFVIGVGVQVDASTTKIQSQIDNKTKDATVRAALELKKDTTYFNREIQRIMDKSKVKIGVEIDEQTAIKSIKKVEQSYAALRKEAYQSIGIKSPELKSMSKYYQNLEKNILAQNKLNDSMDVVKMRADGASKSFQAYVKTLKPQAIKDYASEIRNISKSFENAQESGNKVSLSKANASLSQFKGHMKAAGNETASLTQILKDNISAFTNWYFIGNAVSSVVRNFRNAIGTIIEVDTLLTEISKTSDITSRNLKQLGIDAYDYASKFGQSVQSYLQGVQEMSRAGYGEFQSKALAELSILAQSAGDMTAELANEYIIATNAAYRLEGNVSKLNSVLDSQNQVSNRNAISMEKIANATKIAGSQAANSGVEVNELTSAISTMGVVTQSSGETLGRAFKGIIMNLQGVKGETEDGEIIDDDSLSKVEKAADKLGVKLKEVRNGVLSLRDPMEVLKELSKEFSSLSEGDVRGANLISALGGKYRSNELSALLSNWDMYEKILRDYENASGSAAAEAQKTADSIEGRLNTLSNTWNRTVANIVDSDLLKVFVSMGTGAIDLVDKIDLLQTALIALSIAGTYKAGSGLINWLTTATSSTLAFGNALNTVNATGFIASNKNLSKAINGLSLSQASAVLSTKQLGFAQIETTMKTAGFTAEEAKNTASTLTMASAQGVATGATISLRTAFKSLTAAIAANPIGLILTAITVGISAVTFGINKYKQSQEEAIAKSRELTQTYQDEKKIIDEQISSYQTLQNQLKQGNLSAEDTRIIKDQLLTIQNNLIESYNLEAEGIDLVNGKYDEQIKKLETLSKDKAQNYINEHRDTFKTASTELNKERTYNLGNYSRGVVSPEGGWNGKNAKLVEFLKNYDNSFLQMKNTGNYGVDDYQIKIIANVEDADKTLNQLATDIESFGKEKNLDVSGILESIAKQLRGTWTQELKTYKAEIDAFLENQIISNDILGDLYLKSKEAVVEYNKALSSGEGIEGAKSNLESIRLQVQANSKEVQGSQVVFDTLFNGISTGADTAKNSLDNLNNDVAPSFDITKYSDNFKELTSHISTAESALNKFKEGKLTDSDVFQLMQDLPAIIPYIDMTTDSFGDLEKGLKDIANLNYDNIIATLESAINTDSTKEYIRDINNAIDAVRAMKSEFNSTISVFKSLSDATNNAGDALSDLETITNAIIKTHKLTDAQVLALTERYSGLESSLIKTTDGWYLEESALNIVSGAASNLQTAYLDAQIAMNEMLQSGVKTRLSTLGIELEGITSVAEAYKQINSAMMNQESKGAVVKGGKVVGYWSGSEAEKAYKEAIKYSDSIITLNNAKAKLEALQSGIGNSKSQIDKYTKKPTKTKETDPNKEAFEKSYEELKHKLSMEYITEKAYYNKLETLYQKHFSDKKKYQSEYWQYEEEVYKGRQGLIDSSVNSINLAENSIRNLQRNVDSAQNSLNNAKGFKEQLKAIEELTKAQEALRDGYQSVVDMYEEKYNSIKGIGKYKTLIESGIVFKIEDFIGKEDLYKTVSQAQDFWRDWQDSLSSIEGVTSNISSNYEKINSAVADASNALVDLQSEIVSALKSQYQELYDARVRYLKKETDDTIAMHNSTIKWLEKEIERIQGNTPQDKQKKLASLQGQYKDWLNDDSTLGKSKQKELLDQIEALNKEIKIDALQSQIEAEKDSIDNLREMLDEKLDKYSTKYDPILKNFDKSTSDLYAQANRLINLNKEQEIVNLLNNYGSDKYFNTIGNIMGKTAGELIASSVSTAISGLKLVVSQSGGSSGGSSTTANLVDTRAISDILVGGNNGTDATGLSKLNQYATSQGYDALTKKEMVDLAQKLGVTGITSTSDVGTDAKGKENKDKILEALKNSSFTDGGYVDAKSFNSLVKSTGEDGIALVKHGEPILTVEQGKQFKSLVENLKPLNSIVQLSKLNANNSSWIKNINASRSNEATFNRELVSVKIDKMINQTPFDIKNGEDNLNRMFTKSLQRSGVAIKR